MMHVLQPPGWAKPRGFSNGIAVKGGTAVYIAGQVGWTGSGAWQATDFAGQFRQALRNVLDVLAHTREHKLISSSMFSGEENESQPLRY